MKMLKKHSVVKWDKQSDIKLPSFPHNIRGCKFKL